MSATDDRIVGMHFDNAEFQKNVGDTLRSLDLLKKSLSFSEGSKGFSDVAAAARNLNLTPVATSIESINAKFLALATIATTALSNITSKAISAGTAFVKSFSFGPIMDGFHEFETNMNSIQTILSNTASKGSNLTDVTGALQQLNTYSDKTIYNFGEMARNIGTFTAAGVDLESSVQSIKGIANLAAISGSSSQQASTAMYQLSQAIAAGTVHLQDWNSVVNAGMGGEIFQKALFDTGKAMGTLKNVPVSQTFEEWKKAGNSFRQSLSQTGDAGESSAERVAKANADSARAISDAEKNAADSIESATTRVNDARESAAKSATDMAKQVENARADESVAADRAARQISDAEDAKTQAFARSTEEVSNAVSEQNKTLETGAANVVKAFETVQQAQRRLVDAMKPASADDLQAATDRLTSAQLDQADDADAVEQAQRQQTRAAEDLASANTALFTLQNSGTATYDQLQSAMRRVEDAMTREKDLSDAVIRAAIKQNQTARSLADAEERLTEVKQKGTDQDAKVIDARQTLAEAQQAYEDAQATAAKNNIAAAQNLADVEQTAAKRRQDAIAGVTKAQQDAATITSDAAQRVTDALERSSERQITSQKTVADAEKSLAKVRSDAAESIARAHEQASDRIKQAQQSTDGAMAKSWLTSEVLTSTLKQFTGDLSEEQVKQMGFSDEQAKKIVALGALGINAAQKVKTITQLVGTIKEAIGSGWSQTFQNLFGNFQEAEDLFTSISLSVGSVVGKMAKARNDALSTWKTNGGYKLFWDSLGEAIHGVGTILKPIQEAFRAIFPRQTGEDLMVMTRAFANFAESIKIGGDTADKIKRTFAGLFAIFDIAKTVVVEVVRLFSWLLTEVFAPTAGAGLLVTTANLGDFLVSLDNMLVKGGGIKDFFAKMYDGLQKIVEPLQQAGHYLTVAETAVVDFFKSFSGASAMDAASDGVGRVGDRISSLGSTLDKVTGFLTKFYDGAKDIMGKVADYLGNAFSTIGQAIANSMKSGDFDGVLDALNVGLLGGIVLMLKRFLDHGIKLDFSGGIVDKMKAMFGGLTDTLKTMQMQLKAKALEQIAIAMGVLTASIVILSMVDSAALTKSLIAIAVGFGELAGTLKLLDAIGGSGKDDAKLALLTASLIGLAAGAVVMAGAVRVLSDLDPKSLAVGLAGLAGSLGVFVGAVKLIGDDIKGTIGASLAIASMSRSLMKLGKAVALFASMSTGDLTKGLIGASAALAALVLAMQALPSGGAAGAGLALAGIGMIEMASALLVVSQVVKIFGAMDVGVLAQGIVAVSAALLAMSISVGSMPPTLPLIAAGVFILGLALTSIVGVVAILGHMKLKTLVQGIGALAAILLVLGVGMIFMETAIPGALATIVVASALATLATVIKIIGSMDLKTLIVGIAGIAAVLAVLGIAAALMTPVIPSLLALAVALDLLGLGFVLFGAGVYLAARGFQILADAGSKGVGVVIDAIMQFIKALPKFIAGLADALAASTIQFLRIGSELLDLAGVLLFKLLDLVIKAAPKIAEAIVAIVTSALAIIRTKIPDIVETGFVVLMAFLKGLDDHIIEVVNKGIDIVIKLVKGIVDNAQKIVDAAVGLVLSFVAAITNRINDIIRMGGDVLIALLSGMAQNLFKIAGAVADIISTFVTEMAKNYLKIVTAGADAVIHLVTGIAQNLFRIVNAGADVIVEFARGLGYNVDRVLGAGKDLIIHVMEGVSKNVSQVVDTGAQIIIDFINKMADTVRTRGPELEKAFLNLAGAIVDAITGGLASKAKDLPGEVGSIFGKMIDAARGKIDAHSPSRVFMAITRDMLDGVSVVLRKDTVVENDVVAHAERIVTAFQETLNRIPESLADMDEMNPVITPVLDLTNIQNGAKNIDRLMAMADIAPSVSLGQARVISTLATDTTKSEPDAVSGQPTEIKFEQNNYSPKALTTNDIYRNTKSQFASAKEELNLP